MKAAPLILGVLATVLLLIAGVTVALFSLDLGGLSQPLARWGSARLQRNLAVDGRVSIRAGRTLQLSVEGLRLANASWGSRSDMLVVSRLIVEVDAVSLLKRPLIVRTIEVEGLDLLLERQADGTNNWEFGADSDAEFSWPRRLPAVVDRVSLPGARIRFTGPRLDRPLDLRFDSLDQQGTAGGMLELAGKGVVNDEPLALQAITGPFAGLVAGRDFRLAINGRLGQLDGELRLRVDDIGRPVDTELDLKVRGPGAEYLTRRFGVRNLGPGPLALDGVVRPSADGTGIQGELKGQVGGFTAEAWVALADPVGMRKLDARLKLSGPDLSLAGGVAGVDRLPVAPFRLAAEVERTGDVLSISDGTLEVADSRVRVNGTIRQFRNLAGNDLRFSFAGTELGLFREFLRLPENFGGAFDVSGTIKADPDAEYVDVLAMTRLGQLKVAGPLGARPDYYGSRLQLATSGPSLAAVGALAGIALPAVDFAATGEVEWKPDGVVVRKGEVRAGSDELRLDGIVARKPLGPGTDLTWYLRGPEVRTLRAVLPIEGLPAGAFDLRGRLRREPGVSRLDGVQGAVAGASLRLSGRISDQPRLATTLDLSVEGPRLEAFAGLLPAYELPGGKFQVTGGVAVTPQRVRVDGMRFAAAGAEGTMDADVELPLSAGRGDFRVAAKGTDLVRFLPRVGTAPPTAPMPFDLRVRGQARGGTWRLEEAEFATAAARISGSGQLDWAPDFSATALKVTVGIPDLSAAGRLFALRLPAQPFDLTAELAGTPTAFTVERASGRLGPSDFDGRLTLELGERTMVDVDFRSDLLDLTPFLDDRVVATEPASANARGPTRRKASRRLIPDSPIPLAWLSRFDGSLAVQANRALIATVALDDLRLAARLQDGNLTLDSLELQAPPDGRLSISGSIEPGPRGAMVRLAASGTSVRLAGLDDSAAARDARPSAEIGMEFTGAGSTWREMAGSLNGKFHLSTGSGTVPTTKLNFLLGNLWRDIRAAVMPGVTASDTTNVGCLAAHLAVSEGVVRTYPALVVQTDKVNVITHGSVDLRTEQVEFFLNTAPRRGRVDITMAEIVNPYMKITGSLADPGVGVDAKGVLFTGGAAFATAGISILAKGVWDRMFRADDPCAVASAESAELDAGTPKAHKSLIPWRR